jgi:integrase
LLASIAVGLFAGLRTGELAVLEWENIHLIGSQRFIEVAARKAKTRQRRIVSISDNLAAWLMSVAQVTGPVVPGLTANGTSGCKPLRSSLPGRETPSALLRLLSPAFHKNEALTAAEMGNSPAVIFQHYRALVTPEAAEKFWNCSSSDVDADKVVEFAV